jgi:HEPN domain-containing protein
MNEFTKEKLAFVIGLVAILFTLSSLIDSVGQIGFSLFGFMLTLSHVYYFISISLLISVYFYGIRFITEKYIRITESIGDYLYIIVILTPPIYLALYIVVGLANTIGEILKSDWARNSFEILFSMLIGGLSVYLWEKIRKIFLKKEIDSSVQQLQNKETTFFNRAESLFNSGNYDLSVVESLKAIEIAAQKYLLDRGHITSRKTNYSWIKILDEKKLVPSEMIQSLSFVRDQRNMAAHAVENITKENAKEVLSIAGKFLALMSAKNYCPICGSPSEYYEIHKFGDIEIKKVFCEDCGEEKIGL